MKRLVRMMVVSVLTGAVAMSSGMMSYASDPEDTEEKMKDADYIYAVACIRTKEKSLLKDSDIQTISGMIIRK